MDEAPDQFVHLKDGIRVCYQTFGSASDPPILLLAGGAQSMLHWPTGLIAKLSPPSTPHFIIRYDSRDTGRSTHYPVTLDGTSPYTVDDLCNDALDILNHLGIASANFVGFSLGGALSWVIAAKCPDRVRSLTLMSTSPVGAGQSVEEGLPALNPDLETQVRASPFPTDWHDKEQVVRFLTYLDGLAAARVPSESEEQVHRARAENVFRRAEMDGGSVQSIFNQAGIGQARWPRELLKDIKAPTVILHGRQDRNVPLAYSECLEREIGGGGKAKLVVYEEECAHEIPERIWERVAREVLGICR